MVKKSSLTATILGILAGLLLFVLFQLAASSFAKSPPHSANVTIFDRNGTLLYQKGETYRRAPQAVDLIKQGISKKYGQKDIVLQSTIDLPTQNFLQSLLIEKTLDNEQHIEVVVFGGPTYQHLLAFAKTNLATASQKEFDTYLLTNSLFARRVYDAKGQHVYLDETAFSPTDLRVFVFIKNQAGTLTPDEVQASELKQRLYEFSLSGGGENL